MFLQTLDIFILLGQFISTWLYVLNVPLETVLRQVTKDVHVLALAFARLQIQHPSVLCFVQAKHDLTLQK